MEMAELIREAKKGRATAQKTLFDLHAQKMMLICCRYLKSKEDAEEALQDGFLNFFKSISHFQFKGDAALFGYLKILMVNQCLMSLRKKNIFTIFSEWEAEEIYSENDILDNLSAEEILLLIRALPLGYRTVFNLYVLEGYGHQEIAKLLGISEGTSKSQLSKARILLKKLVLKKQEHYADGNSQ
jgi:RNA polymerase sigma factor (sigma-70 family)